MLVHFPRTKALYFIIFSIIFVICIQFTVPMDTLSGKDYWKGIVTKVVNERLTNNTNTLQSNEGNLGKLYEEFLNHRQMLMEEERKQKAAKIAKHYKEQQEKVKQQDSDKLHEDLQSIKLELAKKEVKLHNGDVQFQPNDYDSNGILQPAGSKIVLVTTTNKKLRERNATMYDQLIENRQRYANSHGHSFIHIDSSEFEDLPKYKGLDPSYLKIPALTKAYNQFPEAEWFWWSDADAIIMNHEIDLAAHLLHPKALKHRLLYQYPIQDINSRFTGRYPNESDIDISNVDLLIAADDAGLNAGMFFIRRSNFIDLFLELWDEDILKAYEWPHADQSLIIHLLTNRAKSVSKHLGLVSQRLINPYHKGDNKRENWKHYEHGDLCIHFPGIDKTIPDYSRIWDMYYADQTLVN